MKFVYTGPSWAASSYPLGSDSTNLAKQWNIPHVDCTMLGATVPMCVSMIKYRQFAPVIWVYNEPIRCIKEATGLTLQQMLQRSDWQDIREDCNQYCLNLISSLNRPVLLIGAHSDIVNCNHANIVVGANSWQKFLAKKAGIPVENDTVYVTCNDGSSFSIQHCWGGEVMHRVMYENPYIMPSKEITDAIWDMFFFWKELEKANLFHNVHPNFQGNKLFAEFLKPTVDKFLSEHTIKH